MSFPAYADDGPGVTKCRAHWRRLSVELYVAACARTGSGLARRRSVLRPALW